MLLLHGQPPADTGNLPLDRGAVGVVYAVWGLFMDFDHSINVYYERLESTGLLSRDDQWCVQTSLAQPNSSRLGVKINTLDSPYFSGVLKQSPHLWSFTAHEMLMEPIFTLLNMFMEASKEGLHTHSYSQPITSSRTRSDFPQLNIHNLAHHPTDPLFNNFSLLILLVHTTMNIYLAGPSTILWYGKRDYYGNVEHTTRPFALCIQVLQSQIFRNSSVSYVTTIPAKAGE